VKNKIITLTLCVMPFALCLSAQAQQPKKVPRIGFLSPLSASAASLNVEAFRQGLQDLGYTEGKSIVIEYRYGNGKAERLPNLAAELVRLKADIIVTAGSPAVAATKTVSSTTPIVMAAIGDAVGSGFVTNLSRPGGNITGLSFLGTELAGKRLELLKEAFPGIARVVVLSDMNTVATSSGPALTETKATARSLSLQLQILEVRGPDDFDGAFEAAKKGRAEALNVLASSIFSAHRLRLVELAAKSRLPAIYEHRHFVDAGGLVSYGPSLPDLFRRAAYYVDKILKGTKPADLPVEQPTKFEFVINLKTAKQIGVTIPPNVLARADKVIK